MTQTQRKNSTTARPMLEAVAPINSLAKITGRDHAGTIEAMMEKVRENIARGDRETALKLYRLVMLDEAKPENAAEAVDQLAAQMNKPWTVSAWDARECIESIESIKHALSNVRLALRAMLLSTPTQERNETECEHANATIALGEIEIDLFAFERAFKGLPS